MSVRFYDGEHIYFRPLELSDEPVLRRWFNDPDNWRTLERSYPINELREREYIEKLYKSPEDVSVGIVIREQDRLVGCAGLHGMSIANRAATFGIVIGDREFQSHGFGTEATRLLLRLGFEEYNLNRIQLTVFADNARAVRVYERAGFTLEGRARQAYFRGGRFVDVLQYAILRSEWKPPGATADDADDRTPSDRPV